MERPGILAKVCQSLPLRAFNELGSLGRLTPFFTLAGGAGALGGKGSKYTVADTSSTGRITSAQSQQWVKPDGKIGRNGDDGKGYDRLTASFRKGKAVVKLIATEDEMLDQMAPVDWRYLSED